jgi:hypothetical protein
VRPIRKNGCAWWEEGCDFEGGRTLSPYRGRGSSKICQGTEGLGDAREVGY